MPSFLKIAGLHTNPNPLGSLPEGALLEAINIVIDKTDIAEPRRGFGIYGNSFGISTDVAKQLFTYKNRLLRHFNSTLQFDSNGLGNFLPFAGSYLEPELGIRMKSVEANSNLYLTTSEGIIRISSSSASNLASTTIVPAGGVKALDCTVTPDYTVPGFLTPNSKAAYRIVWGERDNNNNLVLGAPSSRTIISNISLVDSCVTNITFSIPQQITASDKTHFYQIYRTAVFNAGTLPLEEINPDEEYYLVLEQYPTTSELSTRIITVQDITPDDYREGGTLLYTNAVSGEGIAQANGVPPIAKDITSYNGHVFFANTQTVHRMNLDLLGIWTSGTHSISIVSGSTVNTYTFVGAPEISQLTFNNGGSTILGSGPNANYWTFNTANNIRSFYPYYTDETGPTALLYGPQGVTSDGTNLYICDTQNHTIRQVVIATGVVTTIAGKVGVSGSSDGIGTASKFKLPSGITYQSGELYITDTGNHTIRKINLTSNYVSTLAGLAGTSGSTDGNNNVARFNSPNGITSDGTNLYVADTNNYTIRKIVPTGSYPVTTFAGIAGSLGSTDGIGTTLIKASKIIQYITYEAKTAGYPGNNLSIVYINYGITGLTVSEFSGAITVDFGGTVPDANTIAAAITASPAASSLLTATVTGTGPNLQTTFSPHQHLSGGISAAQFNTPTGITTDNTNLYITDTLNNTIRQIIISTQVSSTIAGTAGIIGSTDGIAIAAQFNGPTGISTDGINCYVSDTNNDTVRLVPINPITTTQTIAGAVGIEGHIDHATGTSARFKLQTGLIYNSGNLYICDTPNHTIRKLVVSGAYPVSTFEGTAEISGSIDGGNVPALVLADPLISGKLGIEIKILPSDTAAQVATKTYEALNTFFGIVGDVITDNPSSGVINIMTRNGNVDDTTIGSFTTQLSLSITQQGDGESLIAPYNETLLSSAATISQQIDESARSLVRMINLNPNELVYAFYISGSTDVPGKITLEARVVGQDKFYIISDSTSTGEKFNPNISPNFQNIAITFGSPTIITTPTPHGFLNNDYVIIMDSTSTPNINGIWKITYINTTQFSILTTTTVNGIGKVQSITDATNPLQGSDNEITGNRLYWSKYQIPEAVPLLNYQDIGAKDKAIVRILAVREALFILKEDGVFRLTGQKGNFTIYPFNISLNISASDSAVVLNNQIFMLSNQGISRLTDTNDVILSFPIENLIKAATSPDINYTKSTFGVSYETDRAYLIFLPTYSLDITATQCYRYNTFTNSWVQWDVAKTCGIVNTFDNKLYLGAADTNYIEQERKSLSRLDYADRTYNLTIPVNAVLDTTLTLTNSSQVVIGDAITQIQYLTIYEFNKVLYKLDIDPLVNDVDYFDLCKAVAGDNIGQRILKLAQKLDADSKTGDHNYVIAIGGNGGSNFIQNQAKFNIIINKLNLDTGVFFSTYETSNGILTKETQIIDKIQNTNKVVLRFQPDFLVGPVIAYHGIPTKISTAPNHLGDPSVLKQATESTLMVKRNNFWDLELGFRTDLSRGWEYTTLTGTGVGNWGQFIWGNQNWGGEGNATPFRTYVPLEKQYCRYIEAQLRHSNAFEYYEVDGVSLDARAKSTRAYK